MNDLRIDGDAITYMAGFAADSRSEEQSHSLYNTKLMINALIDRFAPCKPVIFLTHTDPKANFRSEIYPTYKQNRAKICPMCKGTNLEPMLSLCEVNGGYFNGFACVACGHDRIRGSKPIWYKEIRAYLVNRFGALICNWGEADDWLGTNTTSNTIIASHDKDLLMIPARHWRIKRGVEVHASDTGLLEMNNKKLEGYGLIWFLAQLLIGDKVDNIISPKAGFGPAAAYKFLATIKDSLLVDQFKAINEFYLQHGKTQEEFDINCKLLWIARKYKEIFSPDLIERYENDAKEADRNKPCPF